MASPSAQRAPACTRRTPLQDLAKGLLAGLDQIQAAATALPTWTPQAGPQRQCWETSAEETLYGGAAGGGKSSCAVALPLRWHHARLRALVLRRSTPQLPDLLEKAKLIYKLGSAAEGYAAADSAVEERLTDHTFTFSWGAMVRFGHCENANDWENYQGHEYQVIVFDELTQFLEKQYTEIKSRLRSGAPGLPRRVLATSNPGGKGHGWVFKRWGPWLDPDVVLDDWALDDPQPDGTVRVTRGRGLPPRSKNGKRLPPADSGQVLYVAKVGEREVFSTEPFDLGGVAAATRTFIAARLEDNPALLKNDPDYRRRLRDHTETRRRQLEDGDWTAKSAAGLLFKREWFGEPVQRVPDGAVWVRAWDKAATRPHPGNTDPDWTRGLKAAKAPNGLYYVADLKSLRDDPGAVTALMRETAEADGPAVRIRIPRDPGAAGVQAAASDVQGLDAYVVSAVAVTGSKELRAEVVSKQAHPQSTGGQEGRFRVLKGPWNEAFFQELEEFPEGDHDDIVDALSDAYAELQAIPTGKEAKGETRGRRAMASGGGF